MSIITEEQLLAELSLDNSGGSLSPTPIENDFDEFIDNQAGSTNTENVENGSTNKEESSNPDVEKDSEEEKVVEEEPKSNKRFSIKDTVESLLESNTWVDGPVKYGDTEYRSISELIEKEKPTKELFDALSISQKKLREEEIEKSYLKVDDFDSPRVKLANAILSGANYEGLLSTYNEVIDPLLHTDFANDPEGEYKAEMFVRQCLEQIEGYHPDSLDFAIQKMKNNFTLINTAEQYQQYNIDMFNKEAEYAKEQQEKYYAEEQAKLKEDMKIFKQELQNNSYSEDFSKKVMDLRYSVDPDTGRYHFEELMYDRMNADRGFQARLIHFLLDEEDFINKQKAATKVDTQKRVLEIMKITPGSKGSKVTTKKTSGHNMETAEEEIYRELGIIN